MPYRIRKLFRFEAAHILAVADSKACTDCIHGHSYRVELFLTCHDLNEAGMVFDFGSVKEICRDVINHCDHALFIPAGVDAPVVPNQSRVIALGQNPTAEVMAKWLYGLFREALQPPKWGRLVVERVRVHETETGWAEYWQ